MSASGAEMTAKPEGFSGIVTQVKVPLPFSLKWVNSYILRDSRGFTVVDPGLHTEEALAAWDAFLSEKGIRYPDIHTIVLTHQHPDHYGLAGLFQRRAGAPVLISRRSYAYTQRLWGKGRTFGADLTSLFSEHGMPAEQLEQVALHLESFVEKVTPQPDVTFVEAGATVSMGGLDWIAVDAPGHAGGQLVFYAEERGWMLCGDQVLPDITPNISVVPGEEDDPLEQFLNSLDRLGGYEVRLAFPGHREPFAGFRERTRELAAHHARRLDGLAEMLAEGPATGFACCERLFGARIAGNAHNLRFAMSETLAHLVHLERKGRAVREQRGETVYFRASRT